MKLIITGAMEIAWALLFATHYLGDSPAKI